MTSDTVLSGREVIVSSIGNRVCLRVRLSPHVVFQVYNLTPDEADLVGDALQEHARRVRERQAKAAAS